MNLVQVLPELQMARLGKAQGVGYAEVISIHGKPDECHGVIVFDEDVDLASIPTGAAVFEGVVYRDGSESFETFPVEILLVNKDQNKEPGATFVAKVDLV